MRRRSRAQAGLERPPSRGRGDDEKSDDDEGRLLDLDTFRRRLCREPSRPFEFCGVARDFHGRDIWVVSLLTGPACSRHLSDNACHILVTGFDRSDCDITSRCATRGVMVREWGAEMPGGTSASRPASLGDPPRHCPMVTPSKSSGRVAAGAAPET